MSSPSSDLTALEGGRQSGAPIRRRPGLTPPRTAVRMLAASRLISITGGAAAYLALMYEVFRLTGSAGWLALTLLLTFGVTGFIGPFAGMLGDRLDRRRVMIASDLAAAGCFAALSFAHAPGILVAIAFAAALAEAPFAPAYGAAIPNFLGDDAQLGWANGLVGMGVNGGILVGPLLGGVLVAWAGPRAVFVANAVTFLASAMLVAAIRRPFAGERRDGQHDHRIRAGIAFLVRERVLRTFTLAWVIVVLGAGLAQVSDAPLAQLFHAGSVGFGLIIAFWGGGSVLGSLAGRLVRESNERRWVVAGTGMLAAGSIFIGLSPWFAPVLAAVAVAGFGDAVTVVVYEGLLQRRTPDGIRSRVGAAADAAIQIALAISFGTAGVVVAAMGPRGAYVLAGATAAGACLLLATRHRVLTSSL